MLTSERNANEYIDFRRSHTRFSGNGSTRNHVVGALGRVVYNTCLRALEFPGHGRRDVG